MLITRLKAVPLNRLPMITIIESFVFIFVFKFLNLDAFAFVHQRIENNCEEKGFIRCCGSQKETLWGKQIRFPYINRIKKLKDKYQCSKG